jgi:hypothetical protein
MSSLLGDWRREEEEEEDAAEAVRGRSRTTAASGAGLPSPPLPEDDDDDRRKASRSIADTWLMADPPAPRALRTLDRDATGPPGDGDEKSTR